jgi:hypothetical protein
MSGGVQRDWINIESSVRNARVGVIFLLHSKSEYGYQYVNYTCKHEWNPLELQFSAHMSGFIATR